jgi:hypothetical protein
MRKLLALALGIAIAAVFTAVTALPASADTAVSVSTTLTEPLIADGARGDCPDIHIAFNCGSGEVIPFGHATEEVAIDACGLGCNFRFINLPQGEIVLQETVSNFTCPGACGSEFPHGAPFSATLTDVIIDGTGIFDGATGTLTGTLKVTVWQGQIKLSGTITLAS